MSFSRENGYVPVTFTDVMNDIRLELNVQFGTNFTAESFIGTNWYKYFYTLVQRLLENETKTSEIFLKLQEYISTTNQAIQRPSVSLPGLLDSFASRGYVASVKDNLIGDAGTISICIDTDATSPTYAATKIAINSLIRDFVAAGLVYMGTETSLLTLTNGQNFTFKYYLPNYTDILLRLTLSVSDNQVAIIPTDVQLRTALFLNIKARYRLGWDFEPQRYFTMQDAPWASTILVEYSTNGGTTWNSTVHEADFRDLYIFGLEDIAVLVNP